MTFNHESSIYMEMYSGPHEAWDFWQASYKDGYGTLLPIPSPMWTQYHLQISEHSDYLNPILVATTVDLPLISLLAN